MGRSVARRADGPKSAVIDCRRKKRLARRVGTDGGGGGGGVAGGVGDDG